MFEWLQRGAVELASSEFVCVADVNLDCGGSHDVMLVVVFGATTHSRRVNSEGLHLRDFPTKKTQCQTGQNDRLL